MRARQQAIIDVLRHKHLKDSTFVGAEIGVHEGCTSRELLLYFPNLRLFMIDRWKAPDREDSYFLTGDPDSRATQEEFDARLARAAERTAFAEHRRRIVPADSLHAVRLMADCVLDFAFIDADHSAEATLNNGRAWWRLIAEGGVMFFHDYENFCPWTAGVKGAVDEFAQEVGRAVVRDAEFVAHLVK